MSRLPAHRARAHGELRDRLFEAARQWFPDYLGPGGWTPSDTGATSSVSSDATSTATADASAAVATNPFGEDLGRGLLDAYALALHVIWTYQEAWADEGFLSLARLDSSIDRLLAQIGYRPGPGAAAVGLQHIRCVDGITGLLPANFKLSSRALGDEPEAIYELLHPLRLDPALNELRAWAPDSATSAGSGAGSGSAGNADDGTGGGAGDGAGSNSGPTDGTGDIPRTEPIAGALADRLGAGAGGDIAARRAARARVEMRQLSDIMKRLKQAGVDPCQSTMDYLCQQLCEAQQQAALAVAAPGPMSESQEIALRQLTQLAETQAAAITALETALARCQDETDRAYRKRLDAMAAFLDAFVAGLIQDARDQVVLLRGPQALHRLDRAFGRDPAGSALGTLAPGADSLYLVATRDGRIVAGTFPMVRTGDWFVLAEDIERIDDQGRAHRRRVYREAVRVVAVSHDKVAGLRSPFTRITFEPRLTRRYRLDRVVVLGNIGLISEGASVEETGALSLDGRTLELSQKPLTWLRAARAAGGRRPECRVWVDNEEWTRTDRLPSAGPSERVFAVEPGAGGGTRIRFGDGISGALVPGGATIRIKYRIGAGLAGNRDALRIDTLMDAHPAADSTFNPLPLAGGSPAEDRRVAKIRAPAALRAMDRAVSLADVQALALTVDHVQRAQVHRGAGRGQVHVVVSGVAGMPIEDTRAVQEFLQARVAPGVQIAVQNARSVPTFVDILLRIEPGADPIAIMGEVRRRLGADPTGATNATSATAASGPGLLHPDRTTIDQDLRASEIYAALRGIVGLSSCLVRKLYRQAVDASGALVPITEDQRILSEFVKAAPDERLFWAPPRDGIDGIALSFEEERDR